MKVVQKLTMLVFLLATFTNCNRNKQNIRNISNNLYKMDLKDSVIINQIRIYCKKDNIDSKKHCISLVSVPVYGGKCTFIDRLDMHPEVTKNYPNYWLLLDNYLVFIYDPIFSNMENNNELIAEINQCIKDYNIDLKKHFMISEPISTRILQIEDSVFVSKTDYYPLLSKKYNHSGKQY